MDGCGGEIMVNIILIGMPGCGKSTVGVVLAKNLGWHFLDADILIQEQQGRTLPEIIADAQARGFTFVPLSSSVPAVHHGINN